MTTKRRTRLLSIRAILGAVLAGVCGLLVVAAIQLTWRLLTTDHNVPTDIGYLIGVVLFGGVLGAKIGIAWVIQPKVVA